MPRKAMRKTYSDGSKRPKGKRTPMMSGQKKKTIAEMYQKGMIK